LFLRIPPQQSLVFRWCAGVATFLPTTATVALLPVMLRGLVRLLEANLTGPQAAKLGTST